MWLVTPAGSSGVTQEFEIHVPWLYREACTDVSAGTLVVQVIVSCVPVASDTPVGLVITGLVQDAYWFAPASHAVTPLGRALPFLSEFSAAIPTDVRFAPALITAEPVFGT